VGLLPAVPRERARRLGRPEHPLTGKASRTPRPPEARSLSWATELRLQRRQECPARTRSVSSRLRS
jgi:hypothetical protein